jgi:thymidylate synthase (FAD)
MRIVSPVAIIESKLDESLLVDIERYGRTCYKSEDRVMNIDTAKKFVAMLIERGHHSVLEHGSITVRFINDRGVSHEEVRHRIASYSQESTRYCNYSKGKYDSQITVIDITGAFKHHFTESLWLPILDEWTAAIHDAERHYMQLIALIGNRLPKPGDLARSVLPNSLKTEIVMTANPREWRHFFTMRAAPPAHPQMREVVCPLLKEFRERVPVLFDDVGDPDCDKPDRRKADA